MGNDQKKTHLIFMFSYSPTAWDLTRYGLDILAKSGIQIEAFDVSSLIATRSESNTSLFVSPYVKKIKSYFMLEDEIKKNASHSIYIDCINGLNGFQWDGRKIFRLFKKYTVDYYLIEIGSLPMMSYHHGRLINKIKKLFKLTKLIAYLKWKIGKWVVHLQFTWFRLYQLPTNIFVGNTELLTSYLNKYRLSSTIVIPIHSFDYDHYLYYLRSFPVMCSEKKTCVFLDQALVTHCDFGNSVSFRPITPEKYLSSMNHFFDKVERDTCLKVVIAVSPRAEDDLMSSMFGNRKVIKNKTLELVAQSSLILMHCSTAVSFAVLFNKPILLIKTAEMLDAHGFGNFLSSMETSLNLNSVCIDHANEVNQLKLHNYTEWKKCYDNYKYKYVMTKGLEDKTICEIVIDEFSQYQ